MTRVHLTPESARRIGAAVVRVEQGGRDVPPVFFRQVGDSELVRLGKTSANWQKGTVADIGVWEDGTPPNETQTAGAILSGCVNKFANVSAGRWVILARCENGKYYLIAAECE